MPEYKINVEGPVPIVYNSYLVWMEGGSPSLPKADRADIIQVGKDVSVLVKWSQRGPLCHALDGFWTVGLLFEKMGSGETAYAPEVKARFVRKPDYENEVRINVDTNVLGPGLFRALLFLRFASPEGVPLPIAGFADIGFVELYEARFP